MAGESKAGVTETPFDWDAAWRDLLGYLNFSSGRPDAKFQSVLNEVCHRLPARQLAGKLGEALERLRSTNSAFGDSSQCDAVIRLALDRGVDSYREFHADLLAHVPEVEFWNPFFLARLCEAVLQEGPPWDEDERILSGVLARINDFVGFRPVAVLENGRLTQPYSHEKLRPFPLYLAGAGIIDGPLKPVIEGALQLLRETPEEIRRQSHLYLENLQELSVDPRAHDHLHPVNKRTNYLFGEWDPRQIDLKGNYTRFIVRRVILQALQEWMATQKRTAKAEVVFDASAVLAGTMLMASAISGSGPQTHDSTITLTKLLPMVARQRDAFYERILAEASGQRAKRLERHARLTQQPFGHVRQALNMYLAQYGAQQVQRRQVSYLYARMGFAEAARRQAAIIECPSARFECEIQCRLTTTRVAIGKGEVARAFRQVLECEDLLQRGIECGAIVDPWNILGFQGQFPLFGSQEDSVPDQRVEVLLDLVDGLMGAFAACLEEASARGDEIKDTIRQRFERFATNWDRYGTTVVADLPRVSGRETFAAAEHISQALADWRTAGDASGSVAFWRKHVERFESSRAYARVVIALLDRKDKVASLGLMMQWLSDVETVGFDAGDTSLDGLLIRWIEVVADAGATPDDPWLTLRRAFDFLEANAGDYWKPPVLSEATGASAPGPAAEEGGPEEVDELYGAAYEGVVFRDSTDDGVEGPIADGASSTGDGEMEWLEKWLEPRLKFLRTVSLLWQKSSAILVQRRRPEEAPEGSPAPAPEPWSAEQREYFASWLETTSQWQEGLIRLMRELQGREIAESSGEQEANLEFDQQLQTQFYLLQTTVLTCLSCRAAGWSLAAALGETGQGEKSTDGLEQSLAGVYTSVFRQDPVNVRRQLPALLKQLQKRPLLYVPLEHGGAAEQILEARTHQAIIRFLLSHLPRLGMLRETWHVLRVAYAMERSSRPQGLAVTEFDRLFRIALRGSLEQTLLAAEHWKGGRFPDEELIDIVGSIVEFYLEQWLEHSQSMRLTSVETLRMEALWDETREFIQRFGGELLHARILTLGHVRAILHNGIGKFLDYLDENEDPLHPSPLLEAIRSGAADRGEVEEQLRLIYQIVVEKFDRFLEYNTTTTQSDYGEMFYTLLDFLRLEAAYDRDAWNSSPVPLAHEVLARSGREEAARIWEDVFAVKTEELAGQHLADLRRLEKAYGMRLPSIRSRLEEEFVKPLAVNKMIARIGQCLSDSREERPESAAFHKLSEEVEEYLKSSTGSGLEVPAWLRLLEEEIGRQQYGDAGAPADSEPDVSLPPPHLNLREMRQQLRQWKQPLTARKRGNA
ncbi:MAG: hypothetical protein KF777_04230 [Planctomycetaceae bacterium]|nr:hypothetical protein [Planctomycetaceae bacterium]